MTAASGTLSVQLPGVSKVGSNTGSALSPKHYLGISTKEAAEPSSPTAALRSPLKIRLKSASKGSKELALQYKDVKKGCKFMQDTIVDVIVPMTSSEGLQDDVIAEQKLLRIQEANEIRLTRENIPYKLFGYDNAGDIGMELQRLPQLRRVSVVPDYGCIKLQRVDLQRCPVLNEISGNFFSEVPDLTQLNLKGCAALTELRGLSHAKMLQKLDAGRCTSLKSLGMTGQEEHRESLCPSLHYVDFDGCSLLPDLQAWNLVKGKVYATTSNRNAALVEEFNNCVLQRSVGVGCPGGHTLARFDVEKQKDIFCSHCLRKAAEKTFTQACLRCRYFGCQECIIRSEAADTLMVWPGKRRADAFEASRGSNSEAFRHSCREGVREKMKIALQRAQHAISSGLDKSLLEEVRQDLQDALNRSDEQGLFDAHLMRESSDAILYFVPETALPCLNGCGTILPVQDWKEHDAKCTFRLLPCPNAGCGMLVRAKDLKHHCEVEKDLTSALQTWNVSQIKRALQVAKFHCSGCRLSGTVLSDAERELWHLTQKFKRLRDLGVFLRGNVSIDYNKCTVNIEKDIPFESRQEPDTSAQFKAGEESRATLVVQDLSHVVATLKVPMVLEGHTGATEPREYWQELAKNRAMLINDTMIQMGVPDMLGIPLGCPGGGAKVIVRPAKPQEIFEALDLDSDGNVSVEELKRAKIALNTFLSDEQVALLINAADANHDGRINLKEFVTTWKLLLWD